MPSLTRACAVWCMPKLDMGVHVCMPKLDMGVHVCMLKGNQCMAHAVHGKYARYALRGF